VLRPILRDINIRDMFAPIVQGDLEIFRRGVNIGDMFAPIILGDLGIFRTVAEFDRSEVLSYRDNRSIQGHDKVRIHVSSGFILSPTNNII
jgi:hypothetical protein